MSNIISPIRNQIKPISLSQFNLLLAIWLGVVLNFTFFQKIHSLTPYSGPKAYLFLSATVLVIVAAYNLIFQLVQWSWNAKIFAYGLSFSGGFTAYFVNSLGVVISPEQVQNMMQTDAREVQDLLSLRFVLWALVFLAFPMICGSLARVTPEAFSSKVIKKLLNGVGSLVLVGGLLFLFYVDYAAIFREHRDLKGMISPQNTISSTLSYYRKSKPVQNLPLVTYGKDAHLTQPVSKQNKPKLMVLVVGETARAESFSLNGYA